MPRKVELMIGSIECRSRRPLRSLQARRTARVSRMLHRQCPSLSLHSSDRMYAIAIGGAPDDRFADSFRGTIVIDLALSQMTRLNASRFIHPKGAASTTFRGSTSSWASHPDSCPPRRDVKVTTASLDLQSASHLPILRSRSYALAPSASGMRPCGSETA